MAGGELALKAPAKEEAERLLIEAAQRDPSRFAALYEDNFERVCLRRTPRPRPRRGRRPHLRGVPRRAGKYRPLRMARRALRCVALQDRRQCDRRPVETRGERARRAQPRPSSRGRPRGDRAARAPLPARRAAPPGSAPRHRHALRRAEADPRDRTRARAHGRCREAAPAPRPAAPAPSAGRPLATEEDIRARLEELASEPRMVAHDVRAALADLPAMTMRFFASLNRCTIGVSRFSEGSHWERHPAGDELLHILEGEADVVTLTDGGPVRSTARAGSI